MPFKYDPFIPTFWPARVPNQILTEPNYQVVIDPTQPRERRLAAYTGRTAWTAPLQGSTAGQMEQMVRIFGDMGLVEVRDGVANDQDFPPKMMVASFGPGVQPPAPPAVTPLMAEPVGAPPMAAELRSEVLRQQALHEAGWQSEEQQENAPLPVRHPRCE